MTENFFVEDAKDKKHVLPFWAHMMAMSILYQKLPPLFEDVIFDDHPPKERT